MNEITNYLSSSLRTVLDSRRDILSKKLRNGILLNNAVYDENGENRIIKYFLNPENKQVIKGNEESKKNMKIFIKYLKTHKINNNESNYTSEIISNFLFSNYESGKEYITKSLETYINILDNNEYNLINYEDSIENIINISNLKTAYKHGNKTSFIRNIINPILAGEGLEQNYMPKEIMDLIIKEYDFITFEGGENNENKIYINPNTFRSVFYKVKKQIKENIKISDVKMLINPITSLYAQLGVSTPINLNLNNIQRTELLQIFPKLETIIDEELDEELDVNFLTNNIKYSKIKGLISSNDKIYSALYYKSLQPKIKEEIYKNIINSKTDDELKQFINIHQDIIEYGGEGNNIPDAFNNYISPTILKLTENDVNTKNIINVGEIIKEKILIAANPNNPLTLEFIKNKIKPTI